MDFDRKMLSLLAYACGLLQKLFGEVEDYVSVMVSALLGVIMT